MNHERLSVITFINCIGKTCGIFTVVNEEKEQKTEGI